MPGAEIITSTKKRIGHFHLNNSVSFASEAPEIKWDFTGTTKTIVTDGTWSDITDEACHCDLNYSSPLPVQLSSFGVSSNSNNVHLYWQTKTEINNYGFEILRATQDPVTKTAGEFSVAGFVAGNGNSNSIKNYEFAEAGLKTGIYHYRLKQIDTDGKFEFSDEILVEIKNPADYQLLQNYPNPFNPSTKINFSLPAQSDVKLTILNTLGEEITTLVDANLEGGYHTVEFDGSILASGMYLYRLDTGNTTQIKKMLLVK